jgi:acetyl esterase
MSKSVGEQLKFALWRKLVPLVLGWKWRGAKAQNLSVRDETMPVKGGTIRLRIYTPEGNGPFPVLHFFHGGGWVFGDLDTHDAPCRDLCVQAKRIVVAFDYRLAPEYPFPIPVEDCIASLAWMQSNVKRLGGNPDSIVICGDSAGGNLAAVAAQQAVKLFPGMLKGQVLIYPVMDHCAHAQWKSYKTYGGKEYGLSHKSMSDLWEMYLRDSPLWKVGMESHELATPLHTKDLNSLPRSLFILAEEDVLHDEGVEYARLLNSAGVSAEVQRYSKQVHGFVGLAPTAPYKKAIADISDWLNAG